ncbi:Diacylglycerol pyrophosphate phosphatase 1 Short-DGPP phosphatase [Mycena indigotica]|uniref:Diacylglycerol pyrophosphate phosphatase 1 Short-DGPP phosphatase n=1 Tax=Mycena indigotica TaxID=2126181 RepID=A0A8H6T5X0_9AGAR|nr:Diacylglycerol pyrophosphate phosphatase 1 Short-DGPP phosphatase [Mycena indigotica]KAF7312373.1 Diacylglycerol pyrophosphate phosphatase 1 Short-DGPP phosphatase [Mycena indigotica]
MLVRPNVLPARALRVIQSYGVDWVLAVSIALFALFFLDRFQHIPDFDLTDTSIQHSFVAKEVFSNMALLYIVISCYVLLVTSNLILSRNMWDLHHALLGLTVAFAVTGTTVQIVKITVGRPRPDFIARCNPFSNATNSHLFGLANVTGVCQTAVTDPLIKDGMRSFFSGHSCLSSAGLSYNSLYLAGKLQLFNQRGFTFKHWLVFSPLMLSIWVCITRITDHRHHFEDVTLGFFFGLLPAYIFYRQFYPPLEDPNSNLPYPPRLPPSGRRTWTRNAGFFAPPGTDDEPIPLLPTSRRPNIPTPTSNLGSVETELAASGLMTTPFDPAIRSDISHTPSPPLSTQPTYTVPQ